MTYNAKLTWCMPNGGRGVEYSVVKESAQEIGATVASKAGMNVGFGLAVGIMIARQDLRLLAAEPAFFPFGETADGHWMLMFWTDDLDPIQ